MGERYIYNIEHLTKHFGKKEVLKDINLYFYPGAKIGVIGGNGAGKSTLLKIMAQVDKEFMGTAWPEAGASTLPPARVAVTLEVAGADRRRITLAASEEALLQGIA